MITPQLNADRVATTAAGFTTARFALDAPVLPPITDTLPLAEAVRSALMGSYQRLLHRAKYGTADAPYRERFFSATFGGKDAEGRPLQGHGHAFFLPADDDGDGAIDHVTVVAGRGFTSDELRALDRLRQVHVQGSLIALAPGADTLRLLRIGLGTESDFRSPLFDSAADWVSATPFIVSRYPKLRGTKRDRPADYATPQQFAAHVLAQELDRLRDRRPDLPAFELHGLAGIGVRQWRPIQFHRFRRKPGDDGGRRPAGAYRIQFAEPVRGPLCLGHSAHFGQGLFVPEHVGSP
jgi:CRISPR-associated protein Csb2